MEQQVLTTEQPNFPGIVGEEQKNITKDKLNIYTFTYSWGSTLNRLSNSNIEDWIVFNAFDKPECEQSTFTELELYRMKEKEWHELIGKKKFQSLDKESRDFLIGSAGVIDFGVSIDIEKAFKYSIYDEEL